MFRIGITGILLFVCVGLFAQNNIHWKRADSLLRKMTLAEKIGQLNQYTGDWDEATGPITKDGDKQNQIKKGMVGSMLNVKGVQHTRNLQALAMQSRLKIPLLFGQDVIHGYKTTFPIPLAEAASWNIASIYQSARVAATEAAASGIHWTFAPMVDIGRDPRWGRVMEGAGEDAFLGSKIAKARVMGFQGKGIGDTAAVMACVKHFAAYGAAVGGRDYNSVDMSLRQLWETYLPPFKAAVEAGAGSIMNSFNDLNGIPATGNKYLLRTILKGKWQFKGIVVSDWGSVGEMKQHGFVSNNKEAALAAITAGCDMDMESRCYRDHLAELIINKQVPISLVDDAVKRILVKKFELGLFENPYKFSDSAREKKYLLTNEHKNTARKMAAQSIVLLKNEGDLLPLKPEVKRIAMIGPMAKAVREHLGFWSIEWPGDSSYIVSPYAGIQSQLPANITLSYAKGCDINSSDTSYFAEAVATAANADVVWLFVGEARDMSGEAKSRAHLGLPGVQHQLIQRLTAANKQIVLVIHAGRPLIFNWERAHVPTIVYAWWLGSETGNALFDVFSGKVNPSGKLPMTFPLTEGQIPIYYNHFNTGRPAKNDADRFYRSAYIDESLYPAYPFGFGLSYTKFEYSNLTISKSTFYKKDTITISCDITNIGDVAGTETIQLYIRDKVASVVRPIKELKAFEQVFIESKKTKKVSFPLSINDFKFYNDALEWIAEPGEFEIMIGSSSADIHLQQRIELLN